MLDVSAFSVSAFQRFSSLPAHGKRMGCHERTLSRIHSEGQTTKHTKYTKTQVPERCRFCPLEPEDFERLTNCQLCRKLVLTPPGRWMWDVFRAHFCILHSAHPISAFQHFSISAFPAPAALAGENSRQLAQSAVNRGPAPPRSRFQPFSFQDFSFSPALPPPRPFQTIWDSSAWRERQPASLVTAGMGPAVLSASKFDFESATGLACWLLGLRNTAQLDLHPLRGAIFESWVVSEITKQRYNRGESNGIYFFSRVQRWRSRSSAIPSVRR